MKFAFCMDARNQREIKEIDCPICGEKEGIEVFLKDGRTVGTGICEKCGYEIPEDSLV